MQKSIQKYSLTALVVLACVAVCGWFVSQLLKPLPGEAFAPLGREHITDIADIEYNSSPPTSGPHFAVWAKRGVYDRVISNGHLIHSLEHGYIVIHYNCDMPLATNSLIAPVFAHDEEVSLATDSARPVNSKPLSHLTFVPSGNMSWITPQTPPKEEVALSESFHSEECLGRVTSLTKFLDDFQRIVIVPSPQLDAPIVLTAWGRLQKFTTLDTGAMRAFIGAYHNKGPEQTNE
jgi:hypothetical protein